MTKLVRHYIYGICICIKKFGSHAQKLITRYAGVSVDI